MARKGVLFFMAFVLAALMAKAQGQGYINTVAGISTHGFSGDGGPALFAELYWPANLAFDKYDNMYVADQWNNRIRRINKSNGYINTVAGESTPGYNGDSLPGISAELNLPAGVAVDTFGNIFIADFNNNRIREVVSSTGYIYTIAGNGIAGIAGDGGPATAAEIDHPHHTAVDDNGNLYFADENNNRIRKVVLSTGIITTIIGTGRAGFSGDGGPATAADINAPKCVALDDSGNMYVADWLNNRVRKVEASTGIITTVAGNGYTGFSGDGFPATSSNLEDPYRVALDKAGNFYIADGSDNRIRWVNCKTGIMYTIAGNGQAGFFGDGGPASASELDYPPGLAFDHEGNLYVADLRNNRVREISITYTGSSTLSDTPGVSVYPNPASTEATVYFASSYAPGSISLFNVAGQLVWRSLKDSYVSQISIPLNTLQSGVYMLQIQIQGSSVIWKKLDVIR